MKNNEIKEMNKEQRETFLLMSIRTWSSMVMEDIIEGHFSQITIDLFIEEVRLRCRLFNNIQVMKGKRPWNGYEFVHCQ